MSPDSPIDHILPDPPTRDSVYFLEPIVFQVEDRLFQVPKYYFARKSDVFESVFSIPQPPGIEIEGSSEKKPLKLAGVRKEDFQRLLEVIYPLEATKALGSTLTREGWVSVLKLATMWNFTDIRTLAIDKLTSKLTDEPMEPVEQILLAKTYRVPRWLRIGYNALAARSDPISLVEAEQIGYATAVLMFQVREQIRANGWNDHWEMHCVHKSQPLTHRKGRWIPPPEPDYGDGTQPAGNASSTIETIFREELRLMESGYDA